jgi:hypothetical protein
MIPLFQSDGLLPPGDYEVSFAELRQSILAVGNLDTIGQGTWDTAWRTLLIDNLEVLTKQLWQVGVREIYVDGSFAEGKDHPNDIDGYFVCDLKDLASGALTQKLNLLDPIQNLDLGPTFAQAISRISKEATADVASLSGGTLPACSGFRDIERHS